MDELALSLGIDELEFRAINALRHGSVTATGQTLEASAGLPLCLDALRPHWKRLRADSEAFSRTGGVTPRGGGVGCLWYGLRNTALSNPSTTKGRIPARGAPPLHD